MLLLLLLLLLLLRCAMNSSHGSGNAMAGEDGDEGVRGSTGFGAPLVVRCSRARPRGANSHMCAQCLQLGFLTILASVAVGVLWWGRDAHWLWH
ncbi:MAG: hypothetical protein ACK4ZJ_20080, partial [Allorhizobium sp.]